MHTAAGIDVARKSSSTHDQVTMREEDSHENMPPVNNEPSWRERAESVQTMDSVSNNPPSSHSRSQAKVSFKENIPLIRSESNKAGKARSSLAIDSDTAKNPQITRASLASKEQYHEENMSHNNAGMNHMRQDNPSTIINESTAKNVLRTSSILDNPGKDFRKENIPPTRNEITWRSQVDVVLAAKSDIAKKGEATKIQGDTPDLPVKQGQDVQKVSKRGGDENGEVLSTLSKRRRMENETQSPSNSKTATRQISSQQSPEAVKSSIIQPGDHAQTLGLKERGSNVDNVSRKNLQRQLDTESLGHEEMRQVEVKVLELRDRLEDDGMAEAEIEQQTDALRRRLLKRVEQESATKANELAMQQARELTEAKTIKFEQGHENLTFDYIPLSRTKAVMEQLYGHQRQEPNMLVKAKHPDDPSRLLAPRELDYDEDEVRLEEDRIVSASLIRRELTGKLRQETYVHELYNFVKKKGEQKFRCQVMGCPKHYFKDVDSWTNHFEQEHSEDLRDLKKKHGIACTSVLDPIQIESSEPEMNSVSSSRVPDPVQTKSSRPSAYVDGQVPTLLEGSSTQKKRKYPDERFYYNEGPNELDYDEDSTQVEESPKVKKPLTTIGEPSAPAPKVRPRVSFLLPMKPPTLSGRKC